MRNVSKEADQGNLFRCWANVSCSGLRCGFTPCRCGDIGWAFTEPNGLDIERSLVSSLIPCVDQIRDLYTCFGARAYEVALIRTRWTGGKRGVGVEEVFSELKILPTPKVWGMPEIDTVLEAIGEREVGAVQVTEISARYTEEELTGEDLDGNPVEEDQHFYWEIRQITSGARARRRRFEVDAAPTLEPLKFQWKVNLIKALEDRTRLGDPRA